MQSLWMIVAAFLFSIMAAAVKLASARYGTWEIVMYRGTVGTLVTGAMVAVQSRAQGRSLRDALRTTRLGMHLRRGISGTASLALWFVAIAGLPIATATTINYSSPLFIGAWIAIVATRSGQRVDARMMVALAIGFVGVVLLLRPSINRDQWLFAVCGAASAALTAIAYLSIKALGGVGEPDGRIVFYFSALNAVSGLVGSVPFGFHAHDAYGLGLLATIGISATLAQLAVTRAYGSGKTLLAANLGFTGILFASLWGVVLFGDAIGIDSVIGMAIIIGAGATATVMTARTERRAASRAAALVAGRDETRRLDATVGET